MKTIGILLAAGKSTRCNCLKQFTALGNKSAVQLCIDEMVSSGIFSEIIIVVAEDQFVSFDCQHHTAVTGGKTRIESILNGALACPKCDCVIFHDAARPYFPAWGYREMIAMFKEQPARPMAVEQYVKDSMIHEVKDLVSVDRSNYIRIQTPNAFPLGLLLQITEEMVNGNSKADSVFGEYVASNRPYNLFPGDNIFNDKITTHGDLIHARSHFCKEQF